MKRELGKWFLDIAKYVATAVLLGSLFAEVEQWSWYLYLLVALVVVTTPVFGLFLMKKEDK